MKSKIFNIPLSCSFVDVVAKRFLDEYKDNPLELADVLFLLPNRRACKSLKEAFVRERGLSPLMLPKIMPIGDVEEEELFLTGFNSAELLEGLTPAVSSTERILRFAKLIMAKPSDYGIEKLSSEQALFLAKELSSLIDITNNEEQSFDNLKDLVPEQYSKHWQETLELLNIITNYWPLQLEESGLVDPSFRKNHLLNLQSEIWKKNPPQNRVVIAGTTATFPAMKRMVKVVLGFDRSELILSGIDKFLDEKDWEEVDETHPQFEIKALLEFLGVSRFEIKDYVDAENKARDVLVSEVMRPAKTTNKWRDILAKNIGSEAIRNTEFNIINCNDLRIEAITIALIMRQTLESEGKTAALVTSDRSLARRVAAELERWGLKVDDSAGVPLHLTSVAQFLRSVIDVVQKEFEAVSFLSLLKHPFFANGKSYSNTNEKVREYDKIVLRKRKKSPEIEAFISEIKLEFQELQDIFAKGKTSLKELIKIHIMIAEKLASTDEKTGASILWRGDSGEAAADFIADLYENADAFGEVGARDYLGMFEAMTSSITVRPKYGTHPRLKILGPIEARLSHFDIMIVGEVNEGAWPKTINADPWMSRPMKKSFGLPLPEKAIGVTAHDFSSLISAKEVYITRADRVQGTPMVKSRWQMRIETVIKALGYDVEDFEETAFQAWAKYIDRVDDFNKILPPEPRPPVSARPREMPATSLENWIKDPYIIFARYILGLKKLDELNKEPNVLDFGIMVHDILEEFNKKYATFFPVNAKEELLKIGEDFFTNNKVASETKAFWWPSFENMVEWLTDKENDYRINIEKIFSEVEGEITINAPAGPFKLKARADRIDVTKEGKINIIDYKTGSVPSQEQVKAGFAPQLPVAGIIASGGGFKEIPAAEVDKLIYWQLKGNEVVIKGNTEEILEKNLQNLHELVAYYDDENSAYLCRPRTSDKYIPKNTDYVHLARINEWSVTEEGDDA